jgi:hypothetical protein
MGDAQVGNFAGLLKNETKKKDGEASCLHDSKQIGALEVRAAVGKVAESPSFFLESAIRGIYGVYGTEVE